MQQTFKKATLLLSIISLTMLATLCAFNYAVNAYGIFNHQLVVHTKPVGRTNVRLVSAYELKHHQYDGLIFGSSRGNMGMDPKSDKLSGNWYNASLPGASLSEIYYYAQHAINSNPNIKTIIIGLDYYMFSVSAREYREDFSFNRLDTDEGEANYFKDRFDALLSIDSAQASYQTLITPDTESEFNKGLWAVLKNPVTQDNILTRFDQVAQMLSQSILSIDPIQIEKFKKLIAYLHQTNIETILYFHPEHQFTKSHLNFNPSDENEYIDKVRRANQQVAQHLSKTAFSLWDFSGKNTITDIELEDIVNLIHYYYEGSHYTPATGELIYCKLFSIPNCNGADNFGKNLSE